MGAQKNNHLDSSFEYPQNMFWLRNKKKIPINLSYKLLSGGLKDGTALEYKYGTLRIKIVQMRIESGTEILVKECIVSMETYWIADTLSFLWGMGPGLLERRILHKNQ